MKRIRAAALLLFLPITVVFAQETRPRPTFKAVRAAKAPVVDGDLSDDVSWAAVWDSATKITDKGWTSEMRIPYSQLRFPDRPVHTWGINVSRWNARLHESSRLVHSPKTESVFVSRFADLEGIEGVK